MAISRKGYEINDFGLSTSVRKRIDDLVSLQLTPSTINLFTIEFSKLDDDVKISIGMYIAQLLEIENDLLKKHFDNLREYNMHGNSRDHLIMEQRKTNLQRIQQIFIKELRIQERVEQKQRDQEERELANEFSNNAMVNFKNAMVTNNFDKTEQEIFRENNAKIANLRRTKEIYDFEMQQLNKLISQHEAAGNMDKVEELKNKSSIIERDYLLRREALMKSINGLVVPGDKKTSKAKKNLTPLKDKTVENIDFIDDTSFFDVDTVEIEKVSNNKKQKKAGKNKISEIPNEVLSDHTVEATDLFVSNDISNPQKMADEILSEVENMSITVEQAEKIDDPFLMLLAQEQSMKEQAKENIITKKGNPALKKQRGEDRGKTSQLKKNNDAILKLKNLEKQKALEEKNRKLKEKNKELDLIRRDKKNLKEELEKLKRLQKEEKHKKISEKEKAEVERIKKENEELQKRLKELELKKTKEATSKTDVSEYIERIKTLENTNKELKKTLDEKMSLDGLDSQRKKANRAVESLKTLYIERLKGINLLHTLRDRQREQYSNVEKSNKIKNEAANAVNNLLLKEKSNVIKKDLEKKEKVQELKHKILVSEEKGEIPVITQPLIKEEKVEPKKEVINEVPSPEIKIEKPVEIKEEIVKNSIVDKKVQEQTSKKEEQKSLHQSAADVIIDDVLQKIETYSKNWVPDKLENDDLEKIDPNSMVIDPSIYEEYETQDIETQKSTFNQEALLEKVRREHEKKQEYSNLERKARLNILSNEEKIKLNNYRSEGSKNTKSLKNYRLITSFKKR